MTAFGQRCYNLLNNKYMLFAGWEVRIVKNCDRGLENAARGRRPRAAFSRPRYRLWPRYRRILPALTTNQNAGFVTVPSENKIN